MKIYLRIPALLSCLITFGFGQIGSPDVPDNWVKQNPIPTDQILRSVQMVSATKGFAVGGSGTVLQTDDAGVTWEKHNTDVTAGLLAVHFPTAGIGYAVGTGGTILKHASKGSWVQQTSGTTAALFGVHCPTSLICYAVGASGTIVKTVTGGTTWTVQITGGNGTFNSVYFVSNLIGWAVGTGGTVVKTTNGGTTWAAQDSKTTAVLSSVFFIDQYDGWAVGAGGTILHYSSCALLCGENWEDGGFGITTSALNSVRFLDASTGWAAGAGGTILAYSSSLRGWSEQSSGTTQVLYGIHSFDGTNSIAVGAGGTILASPDGGRRWDSYGALTTQILNGVHFANSDTGWAAGGLGTVVKTENGGATWTALSTGSTATYQAIHFPNANANTGWVVGSSGTIRKTTDGGNTWAAQTSGTTQTLYSVFFVNVNTGWAVGNGGVVLKTADGGANWAPQTIPVSVGYLRRVYFRNANVGWTVGAIGTILKTTDGGANWVSQPSGTTTDNFYSAYFLNVDTGWAVTFVSYIHKTTNGGATWTRSAIPGASNLRGVSFVNANTGWATDNNGSIYKTTDGGTNWATQTSGVTTSLLDVHFPNSGIGWAVGALGNILSNDIQIAPTFSVHPANQTVDAPAAGSFSVAVSGNPAPALQWQRWNPAVGWQNIVGATSTPFSTGPTSSADNGAYFQCVATNSAGSAISSYALLTVQFAPIINSPPAPITVTAPASALFSVNANGNPASYTYQWLRNGIGITGANAASYTVSPTSSADNGAVYSVMVTNAVGTTTSAGATLTVQYAPIITAEPSPQSVTAPAAANFSVNAVGNPASLTYQWQRKPSGVPTWSNIASSQNYTLSPTAQGDNGSQFRVLVTNTIGTDTSVAATLTVGAPLSAPSFINNPQSVAVTAPASVSFSVTATGNPPPTLQWQRNGVNIPGATGSTYILDTSRASDNGAIFRCVATNSQGSTNSAEALLTVYYPPTLSAQPANLTVTSPASAAFSVTVGSANPAPTYQWQRNGSNIPGATLASYTQPSTAPSDNGSTFRCVVSNSAGSVTSNSATLTVQYVPSFTTLPTNQTVTAPASATFSLTASGNPAPAYQWYRNNGGGWNPVAGATSSSYTLPSTAPADNGAQFYCVASNSVGGSGSNSVTLTVNYAPVIGTQPGSLTVTEPAAASFSVAASGNPGTLTYQWRRNGTDITGATAATYALSSTSPSDNGASFSVLVTNAVGSTLSSSATLTVQFKPQITSEPAPVSVTSPAPATFTVAANGNPSSLTYQWQRNGTNISGATSASYTLDPTVTGDNGASFRCVVTNTVGSTNSQAATLSVNAPLAPPVFTGDPQPTTVTAPAAAAFSVTATGNPTPVFQWQRYDGIAWGNISGANTSTLNLPTTASTDNGAAFRCVAANSQGADTSNSALLTVYFPPSLSTQPQNLTVSAPATATFSVSVAEASPAPSFQWQKNGSNIPGATTASYTTPATTSADNGAAFRCVVSNVAGSVTSNAATLTVLYAPLVSVQPQNQTITIPAAASFSVTVSGNPTPTYQWQRFGTSTWGNIAGATSASYTLASTSSTDNGANFRCVITNSQGTVNSNTAVLTALYAPQISVQPVPSTVTEPAAGTFSVTAAGNPNVLTYQWRRNGVDITGATAATYTLTPTASGDNGATFSVVVTNSVGSAFSSSALLTVQYKPQITAQPAPVSVTSPASATFSVSANGNPSSLTYQWQRDGANISGATGSSFTLNPTASSDNGAQFRCVVTNAVGSTTSQAAALSVNAPLSVPVFTVDPQPVTVTAPSGASFSASAGGNPTPTFQWQKNGVNISGATGTTYTLGSTAASDNGASFRCIAVNSQGADTSAAATLTVNYTPTIGTQPASTTVAAPATAGFSITVSSGNPAPGYQWQKKLIGGTWTNIANATAAAYTTPATVSGDDSAKFRCVVSNSAGSVTSNAATLLVQYAPAITAQPANQTVLAPAGASFTAAASGNPSPTYQWQRYNGNSWANISGATSATYALASTATSDNAAQFRLTATNSVGTATSNAVTLTVQYGPVISVQPAPVTVTEPAGTTFNVTASGNPSFLAYQWKRNGVDITGATVASYTLTSTTPGDNGASFSVSVTNAVDGTSSSSAALTVLFKPQITAQPNPVSVISPASATFSVAANGNPSSLNYQWQRDGVAIAGATGTSYTLNPTVPSDNGAQFRCVISNTTGTTTSQAATLSVNAALALPTFTSDPTPLTVTAPAAAAFTVSANGNPTPTYQWQRDGSNIPGATGSTLNLPSTSPTDHGAAYRCIATNSQGADTSASAVLTVNFPPVIGTQPSPTTITAPATAMFSVIVSSGNPAPGYQWQRFTGTWTNITNATTASYTTPATTSADNGAQFRCVVSNSAGSVTSSAATLTVQYAPVFSAQPQNRTVLSPDSASFSGAAAGNPVPTYQWQRHNGTAWADIVGATSPSYLLTASAPVDNGAQFRLVAVNSVGSTPSSAATLTVQYAPLISTQPAALTITAPAAAPFSVTASGNPGTLSYQWRRNGVDISGANAATYTLSPTAYTDNGAAFSVVVTNSVGSAFSAGAALTVNYKPRITSQPASIAVASPNAAAFSVVASGYPSALTYQWQRNDVNIPSATGSSYTLSPTASGDNNAQFRVIVSNSVGSDTSAQATLLVDAAPAAPVVSNPSSDTVTAPQTASFSVSATGNPVPTYQWQRNGVNIPGATTSSYTTPATASTDNGATFRCIATNNLGIDTSNAATLTVYFPPALSAQPAPDTVIAPATATFAVAVAGGNPAPTFQWQKNGVNISGATTASYTTPATAPADNGAAYRCVVGNSAGSVTSSAANLTVQYAPVFSAQPQNRTVLAADSAAFSGTATGNPDPAYRWQRYNGSAWVDITGATSNIFLIPATVISDNGEQFRLVAVNSVGSTPSSAATLTVQYAPLISTQPAALTITAPAAAPFSVTASGNPGTLSYQWRRNGVDISGANAATYTLSPTAYTDNGAAFSVVVTNSVGSAFSAGAALTVNYKPRITSQPASIAVASPNAAAFSVVASGYPSALTYQWQRNDVNIPSATGSSYTLSPTASGDNNAQFRVIVSNSVGSDTSAQATLLVDAAPAAPVVSNPSSDTVTAPQTASFSVSATGNPVPTYQWQRNGVNIPGATTSSYTTPATASTDNGATFRCIATNNLGIDTSNAATLTVYFPPALSAQPAPDTVIAPATATFAVAVAGGNPAPTFQWQKNGVNISGATTASYTTPATAPADNGAAYRCVVGNSAGSVTSSAANLTVQYGPSFTLQPQNQSVIELGAAQFSALATGEPSSYQWQRYNGTAWMDVTGATSDHFTLSPVSIADSGSQFRVMARNAVSSITSNTAVLSVLYAPRISTHPSPDTVIAPGVASFSAVATGGPAPSFQWQRFQSGSWSDISGATSRTYTLDTSRSGDDGAQYRVVATNSQGSVTSSSAILTVQYAPVFLQDLPDTLVVIERRRATFSVQGGGNPVPSTFRWQFLDPQGVPSVVGLNSPTYSIDSAMFSASGMYRVIIANGISPADTSRNCFLRVDPLPTPPTITTPAVSRTVMAGQSVTFTVDASGTAPLQYLWQRFQGGQWNAIGGATAASFTIASAQTQDAGSYRVQVTNPGSFLNNASTYAVNPAVTLTVVPVRVSSPLFTPSGHAFIDSVRVALVSDSGAEIRYTTNGSIPTASSPLYAAPILITDTTTLRAFASKSGFSPSTVVSETYDETPTGQTAKPKADPVDSAFFGMVTVTLSTATSPAEIRYTTSGSDPTASSPLYTAPFSLYQTTTVKAIALSTGKQNSALLTKTYTLQYQPKVHTPLASPPGRRFRPPFTVTFSSATDSASIEYTTDGSSPVSSATRRTYPQGGIPLDSSKTLRAAARRTGYLPSDILTETYVKMATSVTATPSMDTAFQDSLRITLTAGGLNIYFTTDGSSPLLPNLARSPSASLYQGAFVLRQSTTLNAVAVDGIDISDTLTLFFTKTGGALPPPVALPMASSFQDTVAVRLLGPSGDPAIAIHYTTDGNDPTSSSTRYTGPIVLDTTKTLKARVLKSGATDSPVFTAVYTLAPPAPLASPRGGHFAGVAKVTLSSKSRKARIYYTLNGQPPSPATSLLYTQGDTLRFNATTTTLRAIASAGNMGSPAITEVYHVAGLLDTVLVAGTGTLIGGGYVAQNVGTGNNPLRLRLSGPESLSVTGFGNVQFSLQATPSVGTAPFPPLMMTRPPLDTRSLYRQGPGGRAVFISSQESTLVLQPGTYFFGTDTTLPIVALLSTTFDANDSTRARLRLDDNTINLLYNLVRSDDAAKNRSGIPAVAPETLSISLKNPAGVFTPLGLSLTLSDHKNATRFPPSGMRYLAQRLTAFQSPPVFHIGERTAYPWDLVSFPFDSDNPPTFGSLSTLNNMQNFAAARFSQAQRAYVNLTAADTIRPGRGYWVRSTTALTTLSVPPFELRPPQTQIRVALDSGWNMLGNPGPVMLYFPAPRSMSAAHRASRVKAPWAYDHNTDSYVASDSLPPWRGFFVFSNVRDTGFALLSQPASQSLPKASAGGFFAEGEAELSLEMAGAKVTLGAFDGAKTGFGFEDEPALPAFGGRAFLMSLRQGRRLMGDYLPFGKDSVHAFTLITGGNAAERPLRLSSLSMPQGFEAWISAPGRGLKQKMAAGNPGFMPAPGGDTLRVVMGTPEALRKSGLLSGQREGVPGFGLRLVNKGKGFILLLDLPAQATVQARLVDLRGKTTATLSARKLGAGHHALSLEQHFQTRDLARGVYFLQIQTRGMGMPQQSVKRVQILE